MMEQKEKSIVYKLVLVGVPLLALYLFYQFNVVKLFNEGFTGHELMDLDAVKKLFRYHTFGLYVAFEVKHLVGYIMLCGFVLLAASEAFLVGRFLNVVRIVGGIVLSCGYLSFFFMEAHGFCGAGFWTPFLLLLFYFCLAYVTLPDEGKLPIENRIGILLLVIAVFFLAFLPFTKTGSRVYDFYHDSSDGDDQLIRYAAYVTYLAFYACIVSLTRKRKMPDWEFWVAFVMALCCHVFVFLRVIDYPSGTGLSVGYYASLALIVGIFVWLRGVNSDGEEKEPTEFEKMNKQVEETMRREE